MKAAVPEITSPTDKSYTNKDSVTVKGNASPGTTVHIYNGEKEAGETKTALRMARSMQASHSTRVKMS